MNDELPARIIDLDGDLWILNSETDTYCVVGGNPEEGLTLAQIAGRHGIETVEWEPAEEPSGRWVPDASAPSGSGMLHEWTVPDSWPNPNSTWVGWKQPTNYHPSTQRFLDTLDTMRELHLRKGADYGTNADPFANVRASEDFGIPAWVGCMVRANDKMRRLQKAAQGGEMANESVEDSLLDLAVYAAIGYVLYTEEARREAFRRVVEEDEEIFED